ncbi:MAG: hypothetical protein EBX02_11230 [Betaproteobacteria bacterium]|nr:hypothetical protein [Betaproteobacteria bacterium]
MPKEILAKLHADITKGMRAPDITQRLPIRALSLCSTDPSRPQHFLLPRLSAGPRSSKRLVRRLTEGF